MILLLLFSNCCICTVDYQGENRFCVTETICGVGYIRDAVELTGSEEGHLQKGFNLKGIHLYNTAT